MMGSSDDQRPVIDLPCAVCGHSDYSHSDVLWEELICAWGLDQDETDYINVQQGTRCSTCGSAVRAIALARALCRSLMFNGTLSELLDHPPSGHLDILEINEAATLSSYLVRLGSHRLIGYPEFDMQQLDIASCSVDVVIHSDTLEHVPKPELALAECLRILRPGGHCIFTVPVVIGRLTRSRHDMPASYHGAQGQISEEMRVHTEYGADVWVSLLQAGFCEVNLASFLFPSGLAIAARKPTDVPRF